MEPTPVNNLLVNEPAPAVAPPAAASVFGGITTVTDEKGRKIGLKKLKPSQRFQLAEACNFKTQSGEMQGIFAASVVGIDETGYPPVKNEADLLKRLDDLDDEGLRAITEPCFKLYGLALDAKEIAAAKNS